MKSGMLRLLAAAAVAAGVVPSAAWADHFEQTVSIQCDRSDNRVIISHHGMWNEDWDQVDRDTHDNQWNIRALFTKDSYPAPILQTRVCETKKAIFEIDVSGVCFNQMCSQQSARVVIRNGKHVVFDEKLEELNGELQKSQIITRVLVFGQTKFPEVSTITWKYDEMIPEY
jgi:hypothetical protein